MTFHTIYLLNVKCEEAHTLVQFDGKQGKVELKRKVEFVTNQVT